MDKVFEEQIMIRCENALMQNDVYRETQKKLAIAYENKDISAYSELSILIQIITQKVCYQLGVNE